MMTSFSRAMCRYGLRLLAPTEAGYAARDGNRLAVLSCAMLSILAHFAARLLASLYWSYFDTKCQLRRI